MDLDGGDDDDILGEFVPGVRDGEGVDTTNYAAVDTNGARQNDAQEQKENNDPVINKAAPNGVAEAERLALISDIQSQRESQECYDTQNSIFEDYATKHKYEGILYENNCLIDSLNRTTLIRVEDIMSPPAPEGGVTMRGQPNSKHKTKIVFEDPTNKKITPDLLKEVLGGDDMNIKWTVECTETTSLIGFLKKCGPMIHHLELPNFSDPKYNGLDSSQIKEAYNKIKADNPITTPRVSVASSTTRPQRHHR